MPTQIGHAHKIIPIGACLYVDHRNARENDAKTISAEANARLIAAAPDLLEALKRAEHLLDATMRYLRENEIACEHTIVYDDAECDGFCLADDCESHASDIRALITKSGGEK